MTNAVRSDPALPGLVAAGPDRGDLIGKVAPVVFLALWASGFGFAKVGLQYAEPLTFLMLRFGIIVCLFVPVFLIMRPKAPSRPIFWLHLVVVGFLIQTVYFGLAYMGMSFGVSAGVAAVIASTQPLIVAAAAPFLNAERVGLDRWIGLVLGAAGAVTVIAADASFEASLEVGLVLCIGSALGMAAATIYQKRFPTDAHPVTVNLVHYAVGLVTIAPLAWGFETGTVNWTADLMLSLGWLILANSILAISLLLYMIRRSEASRVSALFFLIPPVAALFGWVLLGESLTPLACLGMAVAATGVWLVSRSR